MTCIVAITNGKTVFMGADSCGAGGFEKRIRFDKKIYRRGDFLFGFTSSYRMGQLLGYQFPDNFEIDENIPLDQFMATVFIDKVRSIFKDGGYSTINNNTETGGTFLVGVTGRIFRVDSDFQIGESIYPFESVGCGSDIAIGSLFSTQNVFFDATIEERAKIALMAAEQFSTAVSSPFIYSNQA